jgi:chaperone modulatory protein CbpM
MSKTKLAAKYSVVVEDDVEFTLVELSRACHAGIDQMVVLVDEGLLTPSGDDPQSWRFEGSALKRARAVLRLTRDLELNPSGTLVVLDLLEEIESLRSRLWRLGVH